jgi:hypothetical protein
VVASRRFSSLLSPSGTSALTLFGDLQTSRGGHLGESLPDIHGSEQRDPPTSEPSLREPRKLLKRFIAGIPK